MKRIIPALCAAVIVVSSGCDILSRNERIGETIAAGRDFSVDPTKNYRGVELANLIADPMGYKTVDVVFEGVFHRMENSWMAYYTHFSPENYACFSVWTEVYDAASFSNDLPFLFVRKDNAQLSLLLRTAKYTPMRISGTVSYDFHDYPWIEVDFVKVTGRPVLTDRAMRHLMLAAEAARENKREIAIQNYGKALEMEIPAKARENAQREIDRLNRLESAAAPAVGVAPTPAPENPILKLQEEIDRLKKESALKDDDIASVHNENNVLLKSVEEMRQTMVATLKQNEEQGTKIAELQKQTEETGKRAVDAEAALAAANQKAGDFATLTKKAEETAAALAAAEKDATESKTLAAQQKTTLDAQMAELDAARGKAAEYEKQIETLKTAGADKETLAAAMKEKEQKLAEAEQQTKDAQGQAAQLKAELDQAKTSYAEKEAAAVKDLEALNASVKEKEQKLTEAEQQAKDAQGQAAQLKTELEQAKAAGAGMEAAAAKEKELTAKVAEVEQKLAAAEQQANVAQGQAGQLKSDLDALKARDTEREAIVTKDLQNMEAMVKEKEQKAAEAEQQAKESQGQAAQLKTELDQAKAAVADKEAAAAKEKEELKTALEGKIADLTAKNEALTKDLEKAKESGDESLKAKVADYEKRIKALQDEIEALRKENTGGAE